MNLSTLLGEELIPATGCTEPISVAYITAVLSDYGKKNTPENLNLQIDANLYKNSLSVVIPGTSGLKGLRMAMALGWLYGDPDKELDVLETIPADGVEHAREWIDHVDPEITVKKEWDSPAITASAVTEQHQLEAMIRGSHLGLKQVSVDGETVFEEERSEESEADSLKQLKRLHLDDLVESLPSVVEDQRELLNNAIAMNRAMVDGALDDHPDLSLDAVEDHTTVTGRARLYVRAAVWARMSGRKQSVMSSGGSGNAGLMATLPLKAYEELNSDLGEVDVLEALALSHLINIYIRGYIDRLSSWCGGVIAAGAGACAGLAYLEDPSPEFIRTALHHFISAKFGLLCDGAKVGCSIKLSSAISPIFEAIDLSRQGVKLPEGEAWVGKRFRDTMESIESFYTSSMKEQLEENMIRTFGA